MVCISVGDGDGDELVGISLISGFIGSCSLPHCGVEPLNFGRALAPHGLVRPACRSDGLGESDATDGWADDFADDGRVLAGGRPEKCDACSDGFAQDDRRALAQARAGLDRLELHQARDAIRSGTV